MAVTADAIRNSLLASFAAGKRTDRPYKHWSLAGCLPGEAAAQILELPFPAPDLGGVSGKREVHNATRRYFDQGNMARYPVCRAFNEAFQDPRTIDAIQSEFGTRLAGSYLRVEYAQDTDGFWLEPHTDLGVKLFTMLLYMSTSPGHAGLGTDIYDADKRHVGRSPFAHNTAMVFVPGNDTFHGFEKRPIEGVRKSVIINYVTNDWRAREQLAFPDRAVA